MLKVYIFGGDSVIAKATTNEELRMQNYIVFLPVALGMM